MSVEPQYDEKELLRRIADGDEPAFNFLVEQYTEVIYSVALGYIKIMESAEDVTQEIFYKVWKNRAQLSGVDSLKDYLFIITRNEVLSALRRKGPRYPVGEYLESVLEEKDLLPERLLSYRQLEQAVQTAVGLLPPQQRQAYRLSREEGLSHDEIAVKMSLSKNTVKNHIVAALNFIRRYISMHAGDFFLLIAFLF